MRVPNVPLTRIGQMKIALFLALSRGLIQQGDRVVSLSGLAAAKTLNTIILTEVGREYEIFTSGADLPAAPRRSCPKSSSGWSISPRSWAARVATAGPSVPCSWSLTPTGLSR